MCDLEAIGAPSIFRFIRIAGNTVLDFRVSSCLVRVDFDFFFLHHFVLHPRACTHTHKHTRTSTGQETIEDAGSRLLLNYSADARCVCGLS